MNRKSELSMALATKKAKNLNGRNIPVFGTSQLTDKTLYLNVDLSNTAGIIQLVDVNTKREVGVTNLDGNKLNAGRDYVIDGIRIIEAAPGATSLKTADFASSSGTVNAIVAQAELKVVQGGNLLIDMPVSDLCKRENGEICFRAISTSPLIRSEEEFQIYIEYPKGVSAPADSFVRLEFRAHQFKK